MRKFWSKRDNHAAGPTCDDLKQHVEEEMLAANVDKSMSVESPELHLFVRIQDVYLFFVFFAVFICFFSLTCLSRFKIRG